jgi:hypothetical protein
MTQGLSFAYDARADTLTIEGVRYAGLVFRDLGYLFAPGRWFQIVTREDGLLTIKAAHVDAQIVEPEE